MLDNFDFIIDTSFVSLEQVAEMILTAYSKWSRKLPFSKIWFSTKRIFPLESIKVIESDEAKEMRNTMRNEGFNEDFPISLLKLANHFFIFDGHKRFSASLFNQLPLIPVEVLARDKETILQGCSAEHYVKNRFQLSTVHDWENAHSFNYFEYPILD